MPPTKAVKSGKVVKEVAPPAKVKKDKAAPKQARSAYTFYLEEVLLHPLTYKLPLHYNHLLLPTAMFDKYIFILTFISLCHTRHTPRSSKMNPMPHSVKSPRKSLPSGRNCPTTRRPNSWLYLKKTSCALLPRRRPTYPAWGSVVTARPWRWARVARRNAPRRIRTYPRVLSLPTSSSAHRCAVLSRLRHQVPLLPFSTSLLWLLTIYLRFTHPLSF